MGSEGGTLRPSRACAQGVIWSGLVARLGARSVGIINAAYAQIFFSRTRTMSYY